MDGQNNAKIAENIASLASGRKFGTKQVNNHESNKLTNLSLG